MNNKRYQLLIQWNKNYVESMPKIVTTWEDLIEYAKKKKRKYNWIIGFYFLEWEYDNPKSLTLGTFTEKVLEEEEDVKSNGTLRSP